MAIYRIIPPGDVDLTAVNPVTGKRTLVMLTGAAYARQKIMVRLKFFFKEWFRNQREGIPYYDDVFIVGPDLDHIRSIYRKVILSVQEVDTVTKIDLVFDRVSRTLAVEFEAQLVTGGVLAVRQPDPPFVISIPRTA